MELDVALDPDPLLDGCDKIRYQEDLAHEGDCCDGEEDRIDWRRYSARARQARVRDWSAYTETSERRLRVVIIYAAVMMMATNRILMMPVSAAVSIMRRPR